MISEISNTLVKNKNLLLALPLLLGAALFVPSYLVPSGHALTGLVCVTFPSTATSCPTAPASIGPVAIGQNFTIGIFVQGSDAMGGWDIYVKADPSLLNPVAAALGTLVVSPTLTSICINGVSVVGACTVGTANGPGVVEGTTIESSGGNECGGLSPCSGLALTITYRVVGVFASTSLSYPTAVGCAASSVSSPPDVCVLVATNVGTILPENIQGATVTQTGVAKDPTSTALACTSPVPLGGVSACTATVTDTATRGATSPTGSVQFFNSGSGAFTPNPCPSLTAIGTNAATCTTSFKPATGGTYNLGAGYSGDPTHQASNATTTLTVGKSTPAISTVVSSTSFPVGGSVTDQAILTGGIPTTGVSGTVTYTLFSNGACTAPGSGTTIASIGAGNSVAPSGTFVLNVAGSYSFNAVYSGDSNNNGVTSACEPFTVAAGPTFVKVHWTHHLSLSKSGNAQSWTVVVANPMTSSVNVVVRIVGSSLVNPSLTFDVTCGVTCVNTNANVNTVAAAAGPVPVASGATFSFSFSQPLSSSFANTKITFTATLYWSAGTMYTSSSTKSGAFAIVG